MSPPRSPKVSNNMLNSSPTFQTVSPDNRMITWEQMEGLVNTLVKHRLESMRQRGQIIQDSQASSRMKPQFKRFGEWMPRVDIWDDPSSSSVIATFELPGVRREDLAVHVQDRRYLVVQGQRLCRLGNGLPIAAPTLPAQPATAADRVAAGETDESEQQGRFDRAELRYGKFSRKLDLGRGIYEFQNSHLTADLREGMLTVTWPRVPAGSEDISDNIPPIESLRTSHIGPDEGAHDDASPEY
ncbi:hypothetical protein D9758_009450 [Tetrapyrgos nigripes]|uniref:SHSP domain-containing protein n=1 Tax=Tetrapyrgos nigripes TaxID=182062 RepID=A0A8H5D1R0_9AGAR|nr:hypothetical protein D9758_009450 [Tetrapyrgos nigripes]